MPMNIQSVSIFAANLEFAGFVALNISGNAEQPNTRNFFKLIGFSENAVTGVILEPGRVFSGPKGRELVGSLFRIYIACSMA